MTMSKQNHPWVQDFTAYEAVLCCTHEVSAWDETQSLRAYQTYGFDDASTPGNDQTFQHIDTGILLLHDGDVVAIQFGDGNLALALPDLFHVLNALGWKKAEVYHPAETMGALLHDMGRAIPGHMAFDVHAAKPEVEPVRSPEAAALIEHGRSLMLEGVASGAREVDDFNALALGELESMSGLEPDVPARPAAGVEAGRIVSAGSPVHVAGAEASGTVRTPAPPSQAPDVDRGRSQVFVEDDGEPLVPVLSPQLESTFIMQPSRVLPVSGPVMLDDIGPDDEMAALHDGEGNVALRSPQPAQVAPRQELPAGRGQNTDPLTVQVVRPVVGATAEVTPIPTHSAGVPSKHPALFRIGQSAICFDLPGQPVSVEQVSLFADELQAADVVDVWPGLAGQAVRWDLIGEVDPSAPWFAELVAEDLDVQRNVDRVCFASALRYLSRYQVQPPQLRDVLDLVLGDNDGVPFGPLLKVVDRQKLFASIMDRFAGLLLADEGEAFVDIRREGDPVRLLCLRALQDDPKATLYVVHRDAADGSFAEVVSELLMTAARTLSLSARGQRRAQAMELEQRRQVAQERAAAQQEAVQTVQQTMSHLHDLLRKAGLPVPT